MFPSKMHTANWTRQTFWQAQEENLMIPNQRFFESSTIFTWDKFIYSNMDRFIITLWIETKNRVQFWIEIEQSTNTTVIQCPDQTLQYNLGNSRYTLSPEETAQLVFSNLIAQLLFFIPLMLSHIQRLILLLKWVLAKRTKNYSWSSKPQNGSVQDH